MDGHTALAHLAGYAVGSRTLISYSAWEETAKLDLRRIARQEALKRMPLPALDPMIESFVGYGSCPVSSAAMFVSGRFAGGPPDGGAASDAERVLRAALPAELSELMRKTSRQVAVSGRWGELPGCCADAEVSDAHVHSGGVSPPSVLIRMLLSHLSEVPEESLPGTLKLADCEGRAFLAEPLLLVLGISCILLQLDREPALELANLLPLLGDDATRIWALAFEAMDGDEGQLQPLRRVYNELMRETSFRPELQSAIGSIDAWLAGELDPVRDELARGCMAGLSLLHAGLVSPPSATLDLFVERFNLLRKLRKLTNSTEIDRIEESIRFLLSGGRLKRLELRKTASASIAAADGDDYRDALPDIYADVVAHATAVRRVRAQHPDLVVQMPVSFHRYRVQESQVDLKRAKLRQPLHGVMAVAKGIAEACVSIPDIREFVGSVDVAGAELAAPNWMFGLAFAYIDRVMAAEKAPRLKYSVHAGEQFYLPLDGLRRVGETLLFEVPVTRIGHGLALSRDVANGYEGTLPSASETIESLVWAAGCEPALRDSVADVCRELASIVFRPWNPSFEELEEWYAARFDFERMARIGFVPDPARFRTELFPVDERIELDALHTPERVDRMVVASVADAARVVSFDPQIGVPAAKRQEVGELMARCYEACLEPVRAAFKEERAIESCPSSNLSTADLRSFSAHPIGEFKRSGLRVTVNSDDPGLFGALVEEEIVGLFESGVLGSGEEAEGRLGEILEHSAAETAPGLTGDRCGELVGVFGTGDE
jgi:hypothetical protein